MEKKKISQLLRPFVFQSNPRQIKIIQVYMELLTKWNRKINLTSIRNENDCITRHFGECMFLSTQFQCFGNVIDIGSGAGFPGLPLKISFPHLFLTLLEPSLKKRAFLKEVKHACNFQNVYVSPCRFEQFFGQNSTKKFDMVTVRGLKEHYEIAVKAKNILSPRGKICMWVNNQKSYKIVQAVKGYHWKKPLPLPLSYQRVILVGEKQD